MAYKTVDFRQQSKPSPTQQVAQAPGKDQTVFFRLTTVAPLHIGCDEVYEPTSFVIDTKAKELISFETTSLLEKLDSATLKNSLKFVKKALLFLYWNSSSSCIPKLIWLKAKESGCRTPLFNIIKAR